MNKSLIIKQAKTLLEAHDILDGPDYVISLQGPTIIPTIQGDLKITPQLRTILKGIKMEVL
jgi:hypothetical protein